MSIRSWILLALVAVLSVGGLSGCQPAEDTKQAPIRQKTT